MMSRTLYLPMHRGVPERDIILIGRSLGGGVAVQLAASDLEA